VLAGQAAPVEPVPVERAAPRGVASDPGPRPGNAFEVLRQQVAQQQQARC
jgi:hypothetical protein